MYIETKSVVKKVIEVDSIIERKNICNKCGKEQNLLEEEQDCNPFCHVFHEGGYGSRFPGDEEEIEFHLCEDCLEELYNSFKIK